MAFLPWRELQHTATHCNVPHNDSDRVSCTRNHVAVSCTLRHRTLQHTATYCNALQHTATHCSTLQHDRNCVACTRNHVAVCRSVLQYVAVCCILRYKTLQHTAKRSQSHCLHLQQHCSVLQTATQHTTSGCRVLRNGNNELAVKIARSLLKKSHICVGLFCKCDQTF